MAQPVALITGASSGIGLAVARGLMESGYFVIATVRQEVDILRIGSLLGPSTIVIRLDLEKKDSIGAVKNALEKILDNGRLDVLINNAGAVYSMPLELCDISELGRQFEVNLFGHIRITQICLPFLKKGGGRIINIGSVSGRVTLPFMGPYSASKAALMAIARAMRMELVTCGIGVTWVEAGNIRTPIWRKSVGQIHGHMKKLPAGDVRPYRQSIEKMLHMAAMMEQRASNVDAVVKVIKRALSDKKMRHTYIVGWDARIWRFLTMFLPYFLIEKGLVRMCIARGQYRPTE